MAETVGSLVDKISIMDLKIYHMTLQTLRTDVPVDHKEKCKRKAEILTEQRRDLGDELSELIEAVLAGEKKLKVYRQFKMYNDPQYKAKS